MDTFLSVCRCDPFHFCVTRRLGATQWQINIHGYPSLRMKMRPTVRDTREYLSKVHLNRKPLEHPQVSPLGNTLGYPSRKMLTLLIPLHLIPCYLRNMVKARCITSQMP